MAIKHYNRRRPEKRRLHKELSRERRIALKKLKELFDYDPRYSDRDSLDGDFEEPSGD